MQFLTIFTPTYNRGHLLQHLYNSLCQQTNKNFIWLIVDDGSNDNTKEIIKAWQNERAFEIIYVYQKNGGKHVAHNHGVSLCNTDLFCCVDSDDALTHDAVDLIWKYWQDALHQNIENEIMGFCNRRRNLVKKLDYKCYDNWPKTNQRIFLKELYPKYQYDGETSLVWITRELKKYVFPVIESERFVTEIVLYYQFQKPLLVESERFYEFAYQPDGYSVQGMKLLINNPVGTALMYRVFYFSADTIFAKLKADLKYFGWCMLYHIDPRNVTALLKSCAYTENDKFNPLDVVSIIFGIPVSILFKRKFQHVNE